MFYIEQYHPGLSSWYRDNDMFATMPKHNPWKFWVALVFDKLPHNKRKREPGALSGITLGLGSANEKRRYNVTSFLIGWSHTQNNPG